MTKAIAVLVATYNGEKYLRALMDSLLAQTCDDFTCYIHDDGSTDHTVQIIKKYRDEEPDKIVILEYPKTGGSCRNFMSMLPMIQEPYVAFCDQDDVWVPNKLEQFKNRMDTLEQCHSQDTPLLVFSDLKVVDQNLAELYPSYMKKMGFDVSKTKITELMAANCAPGCAMMVNRALVRLACAWDDIQNISMHDMWCMMIASAYGAIDYLETPTVLYRQHGNNVIGAHTETRKEKIQAVFQSHKIAKTRKHLKLVRKTAVQTARLMEKYPGLSSDQADLLKQILQVDSAHKICRMIFYKKYRIYTGSGALALLCC